MKDEKKTKKQLINELEAEIAERKQAEEALGETADYLDSLMSHASAPIIVWDPVFRIIRFNHAFERLSGYTADEVIGQELYMLFPEASRDESLSKIARTASGEYWESVEIPILRKDGDIRVALWDSANIRTKDGSLPVATMAQGIDITERKRTEEELRGQALIFENIHDSIIVADLEGNIIRWNPAAERIFGYYEDEAFRNTLDMLATRIINGKLRDDRWTGEMNFTRKDGTEGVCETTVIPLRDEHGTITAVCGVSRDITERKQAQKELQRSYHKLRESLIATVNALASTIEMRDSYTAGHQRRVTMLACAIAEEMGLTEEQFDGLRLAGLIHDIGKITVPVEILNKPGRISETEFKIIKTHPLEGYKVLKEIEFPWPVAQIVLQHHERLDGSGYPQGLKNGGIMLEAKILAVADVVEAMSSNRPYRPALGIKVALAEITKSRGILYDPEVADVCQRVFIERGFKLD